MTVIHKKYWGGGGLGMTSKIFNFILEEQIFKWLF